MLHAFITSIQLYGGLVQCCLKAENETLSELIILAAGGHDYAKALYDQPVEKMMAQIQAAANVALEFPEDFPNLYAFLTRAHTAGTTLSEATLKRVRASAETAESGDATQWKQGKEALRALTAARGLMAGESSGIPKPLDEDKEGNQQTPSPAEAGKARARINNLVARKLDAFQNETRYMWDRTNQIFASVLCGLLLLSMVWVDPIAHSAEFAFRAMCCLLAGIAAPFAKDVVSGLASFGKKA